MSHIDKIKARIDHMLRIAENDASTEGEIAAAMAQAESLMRKHNLTREDVLIDTDGTIDASNVEYWRSQVCFVGVQRTGWEMSLARFIAKFVDTCHIYYQTNTIRFEPDGTTPDDDRPAFGSAVTFYGPKDDVKLCKVLFRDMGLRIAHAGKTKFGGFARGEGLDYCHGFVDGLKRANPTAQKLKLEAKSPSERALIVQNTAITKAVRDGASTWLRDECRIKLRSGSGTSGGRRGAAFGAGQADGAATKMSKSRQARIR